jgi:hypothetical protein
MIIRVASVKPTILFIVLIAILFFLGGVGGGVEVFNSSTPPNYL